MKRTISVAIVCTLVGLAGVVLPEAASDAWTDREHHPRLPLVIGHRGATGYLPEHTLASYTLFHAQLLTLLGNGRAMELTCASSDWPSSDR